MSVETSAENIPRNVGIYPIHTAAKLTGVSSSRIRKWEDLYGLIKPADRTGGGQRLFSEEDVERIRYIKDRIDKGYSLQGVRKLLDSGQDGTRQPTPADRALGIYPIRTVAQLTGITPRRIRIWERDYGLVRPDRTGGGHRLFSGEDVERIRWIKGLKDKGMSLKGIQRVIEHRDLKMAGEHQGGGYYGDDLGIY